MKPAERLSRILIITGVLFVIGAPLFLWSQTPLIHVRMAENGGWNPDTLQAQVGKPLHLSLTSEDVVHGFAVGQMQMKSVDVMPGKVTEFTLTFDKPGTYTFYCTRWCGVNHWRMRGTIQVSGADQGPAAASVPLYVTLNLDIDASHQAAAIPRKIPSATNGQQLARNLDLARLHTPDFYRAHSPYQAFEELGSARLSDTEKWDVVAYLWQSNTTPAALTDAKKLFAQNCAACHGENGAGDGVFATEIARESAQNSMLRRPASFADPARVLGASPAVLQGKILRGGMGTGMPMWGSIFTEKEIWKLIAYIYSLQFEYQK